MILMVTPTPMSSQVVLYYSFHLSHALSTMLTFSIEILVTSSQQYFSLRVQVFVLGFAKYHEVYYSEADDYEVGRNFDLDSNLD
jgi:hypothetical protein